MIEAKRFKISWDGTKYTVSIPDYKGGEVVPAEVADELLAALKRAEYYMVGKDYLDALHVVRTAIAKAERPKKRFVAGWNLPGFLPEADPHWYDTFDEARSMLNDELERAADDRPEHAALYQGTIDNLKTAKGPDWLCRVGDYHWWIEHREQPVSEREDETA